MILFSGCTTHNQYSDPQLWYNGRNSSGDKAYDIFYLLPSCVWDRTDANGDTLHYADPLLSSDREAMLPSFELAEQIFGKDANFYSPYYSQITLESWKTDSLVSSRFPRSMEDIQSAFEYYFKNINNGRPFVLAGFSQGAKCVVELLKTMSDKEYGKLIAAYVVGYRVNASDTMNYRQIKPAKNETDNGVTICYNSVNTPEAISPLLSPSALCINPVNWTTSTMEGALNDSVTVKIDSIYNVLIVDGFDENQYFLPVLEYMFKKGNYHLQELYFYRDYLSGNVLKRYDSYMLKNNR